MKADPQAIDVEVNGLTLTVHPDTLALRRMAAGRRAWLDNGSDGAALWQLHAVDAVGRRVDIDGAAARSVSVRPDGEGVRLDWLGVKDHASGAGPFDVRVTIHPSGEQRGLTAWRLQVHNRSRRWTLWSARFPRLYGLSASRDPRQDRLFYPDFWGRQAVGHEAMASIEGKCGGWGPFSMQFMGYSRKRHTLYMGAHDPEHLQKRMLFDPADRKQPARMQFLHHLPGMTAAGNDVCMDYDIVIGDVAGDWFDAASVYADFARTQPWATTPPPRAFQGPREQRAVLVWEQASINTYPHDRVEQVNSRPAAEWVATMKRLRKRLGTPIVVHMYNWHQTPFDTNYPDYFPVKRGFKQLVADLKAGGVLVMPYINGRLWDHSAPSYDAEAERHAIKCCAERADPPLRFAWPEAYGNGQLLVTMCMSSTLWRAKVVEICKRIVQDLGCGGVYLDQLGCSGGMTCVDPHHGHPLGAGAFWLQGMRALMADIRAAIGPEPFLTTENNWEACVADFDALLDTKWNHADNIPLFPAVYGGLGTIYGGNLSGAAYANGGDDFVQRAGMRFVWGGVSGWGQFEALLKSEHKPLLDYFKSLLALRKTYGRCFDRGRMLRPPTVIPAGADAPCTNPLKGPVLSSMWADPDTPGRAVVFLVNVTRKPLRVRVTPDGADGFTARLAPLAAEAHDVAGASSSGNRNA